MQLRLTYVAPLHCGRLSSLNAYLIFICLLSFCQKNRPLWDLTLSFHRIEAFLFWQYNAFLTASTGFS